MPKVSVIIPTHNRASLLIEAIDSVLDQTFKDFEIILVDDGSTDNTREILKKYTNSICYIYQENKGRAEARNAGIKTAKGEYIAFLDDDDIWLPHKLEKQVAFLDSHPDSGLIHTFIEVVGENGLLLEKETRNQLRLYKKAMRIGYTYKGMSRLCVMFLSTVMLRKKCFDKVGIFDSSAVAFEDWDFYLRFALKYRIDTMPEPLVRFRIHKAHTTMLESSRGRIRVSTKHLALLDSLNALPFTKQIRCNFYMHLANTYYVNIQPVMFRVYAFKALKLNPSALFRSHIGVHLLMTLLSVNRVRYIRNVFRKL